jgi:hypothetical protein
MIWDLLLNDEISTLRRELGAAQRAITPAHPVADHRARMEYIWRRSMQLSGGDVGKALYIAAGSSYAKELLLESRPEYKATINGIPSQAFQPGAGGDDKPQHFFTLALFAYLSQSSRTATIAGYINEEQQYLRDNPSAWEAGDVYVNALGAAFGVALRTNPQTPLRPYLSGQALLVPRGSGPGGPPAAPAARPGPSVAPNPGGPPRRPPSAAGPTDDEPVEPEPADTEPAEAEPYRGEMDPLLPPPASSPRDEPPADTGASPGAGPRSTDTGTVDPDDLEPDEAEGSSGDGTGSTGGDAAEDDEEEDFSAVLVYPDGTTEDLYVPFDWVGRDAVDVEAALTRALDRLWSNRTPVPDELDPPAPGSGDLDPGRRHGFGVIDPRPDDVDGATGRGPLRLGNRPTPRYDPNLVPERPTGPPDLPDPVGPVADPDP